MTRTITAAEAKARLADTLRRVEQGDLILITRYGKPVAALVSPRDLADVKRLRTLGPEAGLAGLAGRWADGEAFAEAMEGVVAERGENREVPPLPID